MKKLITFLFTILFTSFLFNCEDMTEPIIITQYVTNYVTNQDSVIDESTFLRGSVIWYPNNKIKQGILNGNQTFSNINFRNNSYLYFYTNCQISNGTLNGIQRISNNIYKNTITFNQNGTILNGTAIFNNISFYPNGLVSNGYLNGNQTISNINFKSNSIISFYPNGIIQQGVLSLNSNQTISNINFKSNSIISFYSNGLISNGYLNSNQTIQNYNYFNGDRITFNINGHITNNFILAITVQNFSWQGGSDTDCQWTAEIQNNGTLEEIYQMNITVELVLANGAGTHRQMFQDNQTLAPGSTIQWFDQLNTSALGGSTRGNISRIRVSMIEAYNSNFQLIHTETFGGESSVLWHGGG